ncbi:MAG: pyruvate ferredoxin oxidoreductase, partial [Clostridiales bacterium]|nr:pyruvate ferredoxin oxidoreductase [Clostridiales bacterium]
LRSFRPFPKEYFHSVIGKFQAVGVIDRSISFGAEGTIFQEVKGAMYGSNAKLGNYIVGLGGRDVSRELIKEMFDKLFKMAAGGEEEEVQFLGLRWSLWQSI